MSKYVLAAVDDLFFASKIRAVASQLGIDVRFAKTTDVAIETMRAESPSFVIADLHSQRCDPFELAERLKQDEKLRGLPLLGFFSHVQTHLQQRALQSGFDKVLPRSAFSKHLPEIMKGEM